MGRYWYYGVLKSNLLLMTRDSVSGGKHGWVNSWSDKGAFLIRAQNENS